MSQKLIHDQPYITLQNTGNEDGNAGREARIIVKGYQSGGELTTLCYIDISHDGTSDDEKGMVRIYVNDGNDGDTPTLMLKMDSTQNIFVKGVGMWNTNPPSSIPVLATGTGASVDNVITLLQSYGICAQS